MMTRLYQPLGWMILVPIVETGLAGHHRRDHRVYFDRSRNLKYQHLGAAAAVMVMTIRWSLTQAPDRVHGRRLAS